MAWIEKNTNFLEDKTSKGFWMKIDYKNLARSAPALIEYFKHVRIPIQEITVGVLTEVMTDGFVMHHGSPGRNFKINFPIYNTEDVYTEWYDIPDDKLKEFPLLPNVHTQQPCYNLSSIHDTVDKLYPLRVAYNMHECPIVFNSYLPHRVMPGPNAKFKFSKRTCPWIGGNITLDLSTSSDSCGVSITSAKRSKLTFNS